MKGADQCPRCASRKSQDFDACGQAFYAATLRRCANCKTVWEPVDPAQIWDMTVRACSFREPCGNCAFRPGSHEQRDAGSWKTMIEQLKAGGRFYCHKGVPINPNSEDGFDYPADAAGNKIEGRMRICRGWLNMIAQHWRKEFGPLPFPLPPGPMPPGGDSADATNDVRQESDA
jgi:hypothetical protein